MITKKCRLCGNSVHGTMRYISFFFFRMSPGTPLGGERWDPKRARVDLAYAANDSEFLEETLSQQLSALSDDDLCARRKAHEIAEKPMFRDRQIDADAIISIKEEMKRRGITEEVYQTHRLKGQGESE